MVICRVIKLQKLPPYPIYTSSRRYIRKKLPQLWMKLSSKIIPPLLMSMSKLILVLKMVRSITQQKMICSNYILLNFYIHCMVLRRKKWSSSTRYGSSMQVCHRRMPLSKILRIDDHREVRLRYVIGIESRFPCKFGSFLFWKFY